MWYLKVFVFNLFIAFCLFGKLFLLFSCLSFLFNQIKKIMFLSNILQKFHFSAASIYKIIFENEILWANNIKICIVSHLLRYLSYIIDIYHYIVALTCIFFKNVMFIVTLNFLTVWYSWSPVYRLVIGCCFPFLSHHKPR